MAPKPVRQVGGQIQAELAEDERPVFPSPGKYRLYTMRTHTLVVHLFLPFSGLCSQSGMITCVTIWN